MSSKLDEPETKGRSTINAWCIGLLAISFVFLPNILTLSSLDTFQKVSLISFSLAIPLLAGSIVLTQLGMIFEPETKLNMYLTSWFFGLGGNADLVGIASYILRLSILAGIIFIAISFILYGYGMIYFILPKV